MNDLLNVVIDFDLKYIQKINFNHFIDSLTKFLNSYHLQSSANNYRIYLAFPHASFLFFPIEERGDQKLLQKFAFSDIKKQMYNDLNLLLLNQEFQRKQIRNDINVGINNNNTVEDKDNYRSDFTSVSTAVMKSLSYSKNWIDQIIKKSGETTYGCRILILKFGKEDPSQHSSFVNSIFACQKLKITIDGLHISLPEGPQYHQSENQMRMSPNLQAPTISSSESSLLQQAVFLTQGVFYNLKDINELFSSLINFFLPSKQIREQIKTPILSNIDMSSACACCNESREMGYACSFCLSLYCEKNLSGYCRICGKRLKLNQ